MASLSLREAAETAGTSKSTVWRAIKSGRLSATRLDDGGFAIDPSELSRVFQVRHDAEHDTGQGATAPSAPAGRAATAGLDAETAARLAAAEAEIAGLRELLAEVRGSRDDIRADRDEWKGRAERLLAPPSRPWWRRLTGAA
jgi:excisionase family DNA binding protein